MKEKGEFKMRPVQKLLKSLEGDVWMDQKVNIDQKLNIFSNISPLN